MKKLLFILSLFICSGVSAQTGRDSNLIQFSGMLLSADRLIVIPFANISVLNKPYGTYSSLEGYFSFVARKGDTIAFSHVEFKTAYFTIPDTLKGYKYSIVKLMTLDTINLPGTKVMPMPNRALFDYAFVTKDIPDDDLERAKNNLELEAMKERAYKMDNDASEAYRAVLKSQMQKSYYAGGQIPPMNILNPFAWAQFFEAWQRGDFKTKKKR